MRSSHIVKPEDQLGGVKVFFGKLYCWVEKPGGLSLQRLPDDWTDVVPDVEGRVRTVAERLLSDVRVVNPSDHDSPSMIELADGTRVFGPGAKS